MFQLKEKLLSSFIAFEDQKDIDSYVHGIRTKAIKNFEKEGFPTKKLENWKYTSLKKTLNHDFKLFPTVTEALEFKDIKDFLNRVNLQKVNTKTFEALIKAGAFDSMGYDRTSLLENVSAVYAYIKDVENCRQRKIDVIERNNYNNKVTPLIERRTFLRKEVRKIQNRIDKDKVKEGDLDAFHLYSEELQILEEQKIKRLPALQEKEQPIFPELLRGKYIELDMKTILDQARYIGCYIGGHPMDLLKVRKDDISNLTEGTYAEVVGVVLSVKEIITRKGKKMAFIEIDDSTSSAEIVVFPQLWPKVQNLEVQDTDIIRCRVKVESTSPDTKLILNKIQKYRDENEMDT